MMRPEELLKKEEKASHLLVAIFVDMQNIYYGAKHYLGKRLDFEKLLNLALRGRRLYRAIVYLVNLDRVKQDFFINVLKKLGYEIKLKNPKKFYHWDRVKYKADWDMGIAIDAISIADSGKVDVIVLMSGDGDFIDLVSFLKAKGLKVEIVSFRSITAKELIQTADEYIDLEEVAEFISLDENDF